MPNHHRQVNNKRSPQSFLLENVTQNALILGVYEKNGVKYSHTIDPRTGYPAKNSLLSASVLTDDCMTADAFATAFMVLGVKESILLSKELDYLEVYFIYTDSLNKYNIFSSEGFSRVLSK